MGDDSRASGEGMMETETQESEVRKVASIPERLAIVKVAVAGGGHDDLMALLSCPDAPQDALQGTMT